MMGEGAELLLARVSMANEFLWSGYYEWVGEAGRACRGV